MTQDTAVENITPKTASELSYEFGVIRWAEQDEHKAYIASNTIGLKVGNKNRSRLYVVRAPLKVVRNAKCNQHESDDSKLIVQIFILELFRHSQEELRRQCILGVTPLVNGEREFYLLTGSYSKMHHYDDNERLRAKALVTEAHIEARLNGYSPTVFTNQLGRNKRDYIRGTASVAKTGTNSPHYLASEKSAW